MDGLSSQGRLPKSFAGAPAAAPTPPDLTPGTDVISRLRLVFDRVDLNHNGILSPTERESALEGLEILGKDAAALCTLEEYLPGEKLDRRCDKAGLDALERECNDRPNLQHWMDDYYADFLDKLSQTPKVLFATGSPNPALIDQGRTLSCGFLSALRGVVRRQPGFLETLVREKSEGGYVVNFPGLGREITVGPLSDGEIMRFSSARKDGLWLSVLEKAWGSSRNEHAANGMATLPEDSIGALTGHDCDFVLTKQLKKLATRSERRQPLRPLTAALAQDRVVLAWSQDKPKLPGLQGNHIYLVAGYDSRKGLIRVYNTGPGWGEPAVDGKPRDGFQDGLAELTVDEFCKSFKGLVVESDRPYPSEEFGYGMLHHKTAKRYPHWR